MKWRFLFLTSLNDRGILEELMLKDGANQMDLESGSMSTRTYGIT